MKSKKKISLAERLQALNTSKPSEIRIEAPHFEVPLSQMPQSEPPRYELPKNGSPPSVVTRIEHTPFEQTQNELPQNEVTHLQQPPSKVSNIEVPQIEHTEIEYAKNEVTRIVVPHSEESCLEVPEKEFTEIKETQKEAPRKKKPQSEAPDNEAPLDEITEEKGEPKGYFKLAHSVFFDPQMRALSGDSFRLYLWMSSRAWQFQNSSGGLRAAVRWITEITGISHSTVSRSLRALQDAGLIEALKVDPRLGNVWQVTPKAVWKKPIENEKPVDSEKKAGTSNRVHSDLKMNTQVPQNEGNLKKLQEREKKTTSLPAETSERIDLYFQHCKPFRKKEAEWKSYQGLLRDYNPEQIGECLDFLLTNGLPKTQETCRLPMSYLSYSMQTVLTEIDGKRKRLAELRAEVDRKRREREEDEQYAKELAIAEAAFRKTFVSESDQKQVVETYFLEKLEGKKNAPDFVIREWAVKDWYRQQIGQSA
ncbi:MAG: ArsR family transcriptional regulator [Bacteriovoracia bacterium]